MDVLTTKKAAKKLKCGLSTIRKHARKIGLKKIGYTWIIEPKDLDLLASSIHHTWRSNEK